ncbi:MAG: hypothetical protein ACK413_02020 [Patescibacteria group bacterium]
MSEIKKISFLLFLLSFLFFSFAYSKTIELYFFWGSGCPHSAQMAQFLREISPQYPELKINALEVWYNPANQKLLLAMAEGYKMKFEAVPVVFVGNLSIEGAGPSQFFQIKEEIRRCSISGCPSPIERIKTVPAKNLNFKNIALFFGGLIIFLIIVFSFFKKEKK